MSTTTVKHQHHASAPLPRTLVTGASCGIGHALALQLAQAGVPVVGIGRDMQRLRALAASHPLIDVMQLDLADIDRLGHFASELAERFPDLGCLIHNAGVQHDRRLDDDGYGAEAIGHEIDVNLVAPMVLTQALLPHLMRQPKAWVVNVTSGLAFAPKRSAAVYSASKAGLHLFTQALRVQLQGTWVKAVEVVFPLVDTAMTQGRGKGKLPVADAADALIEGLLAGHSDIYVGKARAIAWLQRWAPGLLARAMQAN